MSNSNVNNAPIIYKITSPSNKIYIGQTVNIIKRKSYYKKGDCKAQPKLYSSFKKYGWDNHLFELGKLFGFAKTTILRYFTGENKSKTIPTYFNRYKIA